MPTPNPQTATTGGYLHPLIDSASLFASKPRPEADGYCVHGKWVGGMGIDWICQPCEFGETTLVRGNRFQLMGTITDTETGKAHTYEVTANGQSPLIWHSGARTEWVLSQLHAYADGIEWDNTPDRFEFSWHVDVQPVSWWEDHSDGPDYDEAD